MRHPGQPWLQITVSHTAPERVEAMFETLGALAITLRDGGDEALIEPEPGASPLWRQTDVIGLFPAQSDPQQLMRKVITGLELAQAPAWQAELIEDRDWVRAWLEDYRPMRFGENLWVCPKHETVHAENAIVLKLDPGLAFGTGAHASTALCLEWLDAHPPTGQCVIDYGCGSGILGIAAALLGARAVAAVDIDPQALIATRDNAIGNGVEKRIETREASRLSPGSADLVLANILAGPLTDLAAELTGLLRPGGTLVMAGLLEHQAQAVQTAYTKNFAFEPVRSRDGWACLVAQRYE